MVSRVAGYSSSEITSSMEQIQYARLSALAARRTQYNALGRRDRVTGGALRAVVPSQAILREPEANRLLVEAYNEAALSVRICHEWFKKFEKCDFDVEDKDRSGRPKIYEDVVWRKEEEKLLEEDSSQTQKKLALTLEVTRQAASHRLKSLGIVHKQGLPHPPHSPDIASSDYHLFRSMAHALSEQRFTSYEDIKNWVDLWIASKDKEFFSLRIRTLPER
ncbi:Mariner Mos1 transposase [Eumeta japonica]|uniref:Mariner Mos1 transposase n=1 Tax=Eumeta variegata TaxID=151549 RepID=A0A4C1U5X2_EUMVA|nr:Mariner Mos1 transposase [Eumeta japonica]